MEQWGTIKHMAHEKVEGDRARMRKTSTVACECTVHASSHVHLQVQSWPHAAGRPSHRFGLRWFDADADQTESSVQRRALTMLRAERESSRNDSNGAGHEESKSLEDH